MVSSITLHEIKRQIEYYLSDENLANDQFFHNHISSSPSGYINLDLILQCNKIKKANWSKDEIISGITFSKVLELSNDKTQIRRRDNPPLPTLSLLNKKRHKEKESSTNNNNEPIILTIQSDKPTEESWKVIEEHFKSINPSITVQYARFKSTEGNFGIIPSNANTSKTEVTWTTTFELNGVKYTVDKCEGDRLKNFWKDHGSHMTLCVKPKQKKKNKKDETKLPAPILLGDAVYYDIGFIKNRTRKLLSMTIEGSKIEENDQAFMVDLLKYHNNKEKIMNGLDYFTTGKTDDHHYTRVFYAVDNTGKKVDFVLGKCIEKLMIDNKKKNKTSSNISNK